MYVVWAVVPSVVLLFILATVPDAVEVSVAWTVKVPEPEVVVLVVGPAVAFCIVTTVVTWVFDGNP